MNFGEEMSAKPSLMRPKRRWVTDTQNVLYELWKYEINLFRIVSSVEFCKNSVEHLLSETLVPQDR